MKLELVPPNLARLGVKRRIGPPEADLLTIWDTPYPVLARYKLLCRDLRIEPYAGGTMEEQGPSYRPGFITSGYRDAALEDRSNSPHMFAFALDVAIGPADAQIEAAQAAVRHFARIGLYPARGFIHVDLAPDCWMVRFGGIRFWVQVNGVYHYFDDFEPMIEFARSAS